LRGVSKDVLQALAAILGDAAKGAAPQDEGGTWLRSSRLNASLTSPVPTIASARSSAAAASVDQECGMDLELFPEKTPATIGELQARVAAAFGRHPLCRDVRFDIVGMPRTAKGNWTVSMQSVAPDALWEASELVSDIQDAYDLAVAA
jgi:hypothetical protein